ncbi:MAG: histidine--tRNA ligase [Candidatus Bathyarchaeota archaeon]|nr:histidine--tRNA ligase [Candidatus Bathyarchaeota archaeon]
MFQPPKGTRDFLPDEMLKRNWVLDKIREVYELYGFEPLGTPAFESWELLKMKSGADVINQIYYFKDKSERELGLRFEWTASLARVVANHRELLMPFKRYAIGPVWRYENPSEKRFREFWQADADTIGVSDSLADAEILAFAVECLRKIVFEVFVIKLNDRRILETLIQISVMPKEHISDIIRTVDKLDKIGRDAVIDELSHYVSNKSFSINLLDRITVKDTPEVVLSLIEAFFENSDQGINGCTSLREIVGYAKSFGYYEYLTIDLSLARGLDYYTGPVFEITAKGYEDYGSIAGGGRYDEIINVFGGESTPATGIALGIERIVSLLEMKGGFKDLKLGADVLVAAIGKKAESQAILIAQNLRSAGVPTLIDLLSRNLRKQLEYASKKNVRKVVIIGDKELMEDSVTVRDMDTGQQIKVKRGELLNFLGN